MKQLAELKHGLEEMWESLSQGWQQIRERAGEALTLFKPGNKPDPPANRENGEDFFSLRAPTWGLLSGEVFEDDAQVIVRLEVPGLEKTDFNIEVRGKQLTVCGEKHFKQENTKGRYRMRQCAYGSFRRSLTLPAAVKSDKAEAKYHNGVLRIVLPKAEHTKPKHIEVKAG